MDMNIPRIEISPPGSKSSEYVHAEYRNLYPQSQSPGFDASQCAPNAYGIDYQRINSLQCEQLLTAASPQQSYYSSPDVSPMGSRNSSYSDLENLAFDHYMRTPGAPYSHIHGGHSDSEMMGSQEFDAQTKRRKVAGRARSSSYVEGVFGKPKRDFDMVHTPEWMHNYPSKFGNIEIKVSKQPVNHRAQYVGEGSRGPVRADRGYPQVTIKGFIGTGVLRTFLLAEDSDIKYHPFYQVCKVLNKQGTSHMTTETKIDGVMCIETRFQSKTTHVLNLELNSVGILKLKNSTVEATLGPTYFTPRSTRVRIAFMAILQDKDDRNIIVQDISEPIGCNQMSSEPVVLKISDRFAGAEGGKELWVIGKHFRHIKVYFQEKSGNNVVWKAEATLNKNFLAANHLICTVPPYKNTFITEPVPLELYVTTQYKDQIRVSQSVDFLYTPEEGNQARSPAPPATVNPNQSEEINETTLKQIKNEVDVEVSRKMENIRLNQNANHTSIKDIGKTDSFDRMICALKYSVEQMSGQHSSVAEFPSTDVPQF